MIVRELINALLDCDMESDVKVKLTFQDVEFEIDEDIIEVRETNFKFEDCLLEIDIDFPFEEKFKIEEA